MERKKQYGFTFVEVMVVVLIIGIVAAIALPNFRRSVRESQKSACIANLKLLTSAVEEAKFRLASSEITVETLVGPENYLKRMPFCPAENAVYTELDPPRCPTMPEEHFIPPEE